jgi:oxepin-CoA hydrolase / 3-oxo-5,6-dehydrosuberyl-CoA semialdehyde dehydrogenase
VKARFDVNDAALRESFLRDTLVQALAPLTERSQPRWGGMTAQQMVEHLVWVFELSMGEAHVECTLPPDKIERMKTFLYHNMPMMKEFRNPALVEGLPALRFASLAEAQTALRREAALFLENAARNPAVAYTHPVFGRIGAEEWQRSHFKHAYHHLMQFGLVEME